jgi:hypothetical protein
MTAGHIVAWVIVLGCCLYLAAAVVLGRLLHRRGGGR